MSELKPGSIIAGRQRHYIIVRERRGSSTGKVYEAHLQDDSNHIVAIKMWNEPQKHLYELELARLRKAWLMWCEDEVYHTQTGQLIGYVMPFRPVSLREWYKPSMFHQISDAQVKTTIDQIASGISAIHQAGFVHLDIKPLNILFEKGGVEPFVSDFSSAQRIAAFSEKNIATTPLYYPKHLPTGSDPRLIDIYEMATSLYEMFEGRLPPADQHKEASFQRAPAWSRLALRRALNFEYREVREFRRDIEGAYAQHIRNPQQPEATPPLSKALLEALRQPTWTPIPARLIQAVQVVMLLVATWLTINTFPAVRDEGLYRLGMPFLVVLLGCWRPGLAAFVALLIQTLLLLAVAPAYGLTLALLTLGLGLGSLASGNSWLLILLAILPVLQHIVPLVLFPALVWLLKPDRFQTSRLPIATIAVGMWFSLYLIGIGASPFPDIYRQAAGPPIDFSGEIAPTLLAQHWPALLQTPRELNSAFLSNLALLYPLWPLITWASVECLGALSVRRLRTKLFQPLVRGVGSVVLLALTCAMLGLGIFFAADNTWQSVFSQIGALMSEEGPLLVMILLAVGLFYDPSDNDPPTRPVWPLTVIVIAAIVLSSALPALNGYLPASAGAASDARRAERAPIAQAAGGSVL